MKTKGQLLIAASILLVAIYLVFINPDKELKTPVLADPTITTTKEEASISVDKKQLVLELKNQLITDQIEFTENEKTHRSFNNVSNAKQAQSIIDETYAAGEDELAQQLERDLFGRCANPDYYSSVQKKNVEWLQESSHKYCDSYTTTMSFDENTERSLSITNLLVKKINSSEALIKKTDNSEKMKAVSDLINQATSRPELAEISLLWYRVLQSNPSASLSQLQYPYVSSNDYFSDIYIASFDLYGCYKFGGCESGQWYILWVCAMSGQCQQGWSVYDFYENILSLNELENVVIILQYLFDQQSNP